MTAKLPKTIAADPAACDIATQIERRKTMLTPQELAELLHVSPKAVYSWARRGTLPVTRFGASIRFDPHLVAVWVRGRTA